MIIFCEINKIMMSNKEINLKLSTDSIMSTRQKYNNNIRKYIITTYNKNAFQRYQNNALKNNSIRNTITEYYYKNPFFYNDNNLNIQLQVLKDLQKMQFYRNQTPGNSNTNLNTNHSSAISQNKINSYKKEKIRKLSINNKTDYKDNAKAYNLKFPSITRYPNENDNKMKIEINENTSINEDKNDMNSIDNISNSDKSPDYSNYLNTQNKLKESDEYFYKIVFKSKPLFKSAQKLVVDNKFNMIYAENEAQYKKIIEKEYKRLISEGKKVKSKNVAPSIKLKLNEAKSRIQFMKGVMDYSYPGFVLSKIKIMQKNLKKQKKKAKYINYLNGMEKRKKENDERNEFRKEYLLKSITLFK